MAKGRVFKPFCCILKKDSKKGSIFFLILATILVVTILSGVLLNIVRSQSRLTHHQVSRIQAYYAAQAGINYALEKLRVGNDPTCWGAGGGYTRLICRSACGGCNINDANLPSSVPQIAIAVSPGLNGLLKVSATATYTYSTP
jgi:Tfp pilus assembly protein PilX